MTPSLSWTAWSRSPTMSACCLKSTTSSTIATIGIDFALDAELEPDAKLRQLDVYLARNETLLAWGRTPSFTYEAAASRGAAVFVARPGRLSTFPLRFALDDPDVLAAHALGHGLVILSGDGTTTFLDGLTLDVRGAAPLTGKLPAADDGAFVGDALGGVQRVAWNEGLRAFRFDPGDNTWIERSLADASNVGPRPGAAHLVDDAREVLLLYGGGEQTDVLAVNLLPGGPAIQRVDGITLDTPRRGASAMALVREGIGLDSAVLFGSEDPAAGVIHLAGRDQTVGPDGPWVGGSCVQLDRGGANASLRVLCAGGLREDAPTSDAILLTVPGRSSGDAPTATELPELLESPMEHVFWLLDGDAVHAQGGGRLLRVERETLAVEEIQETARSRGGSCVRLPTGSSYLVGGVDGAHGLGGGRRPDPGDLLAADRAIGRHRARGPRVARHAERVEQALGLLPHVDGLGHGLVSRRHAG